MNKLVRHFVIVRVISLLSALITVLLLDMAFQPKVKVFSGITGMLVFLLLWIMTYVTLSIGIALHDMTDEQKENTIAGYSETRK